MGRLEDELAKIAAEMEALDHSRLSHGQEREAHLRELIRAIHEGRDVSDYDPAEVEKMRETLRKIDPAARKVAERLRAKGATIGEDGGLRFCD